MKNQHKVKITITGTYTIKEINAIEDFVLNYGYDNFHMMRLE